MCAATSNGRAYVQTVHRSERRGSLIILTITILIIIIIVIAGVCSAALLEKSESQIVILWLIGVLLVVGIVSFTFLEIQRRKAARNRDMGAAEYVQQIYEQQQRQGQLSQNKSATWALTEPWRYNQRSSTHKAPQYDDHN